MKMYVTVAIPFDNKGKSNSLFGRVISINGDITDAVYIGMNFIKETVINEYKVKTGDMHAEATVGQMTPIMFGQSFICTLPDNTGYEIDIYEYVLPENVPPQPIPVNFVKS